MFSKLTRTSLLRSFQQLPKRNLASDGSVPLAFLQFPKDGDLETESNLIVMHGLFGSKNNWNSICKRFADKTNPSRKIFAIDARNHGESAHTPDHNYQLMSSDLRNFMVERSLAKSSILGHSMGGRAVIYFALTHPELVEKLVVVDISPRGRIGKTQSDIPLFIHAMKSIELDRSLTIHQARSVADESLKAIISEKSLRDFLITNLAKDDDGDFRWRINLETLDRCFQEGIAEFPDVSGMCFPGPTLFIGGSKSDYLRPSDEPFIKELFPNSQLEFLDAGHWVHAERSEDFTNLVLKFLNQ